MACRRAHGVAQGHNGPVRSFRDEGVVLRTHKLGEADRIVTILTHDHGQIRAVAKGVRKTTSRIGSRLAPFNHVEVQLYPGRSLHTVVQVETIEPYARNIEGDYQLYTCASVMAETAEQLSGDEPTAQQYLLLVGALHALSRRRHPAQLVLDSYLLRAVALAGWAPSFWDCAVCGAPGPHLSFHVAAGGAVCVDCRPAGSAQPRRETLMLLGDLLTGDWPSAEATTPAVRMEASGLVAAYVQWHLERHLKSIALVERA